VNHDRLYRGSQLIPAPLAQLLHIDPGSRQIPIEVDGATVRATWQLSPYLFGGELRLVLDGLGLSDGELARLLVLGPRRLHIAPAPPKTTPRGPYRILIEGAGLYDAGGQPVRDGEIAAALAFAIGLPEDAPLRVVERRLSARQNADLQRALVLIHPEILDQ
jgi:hypothetical protein